MKVKFVAVLCLAGALSAAPITGLFNTGQSITGSADNYWTLIAPPGAGQVLSPVAVHVTWLPNTPASSWEWSTTAGTPVGTALNPLVYTFRHTFILDSLLNPATALITMVKATLTTACGTVAIAQIAIIAMIAASGGNRNGTRPVSA